MIRIILGLSVVLVISCTSSTQKSNQLAQKPLVLQVVSGGNCDATKQNPSQLCNAGLVCDPMYAGSLTGTCRLPCPTLGGGCASGEVCNVVNGLCEPSCKVTPATQTTALVDHCPSDSFSGSSCSNQTGTGIGYCQKLCSASDPSCPTGYACARGICAPKCSKATDCLASGQVCGLTTGTCEFSCDLGAATNPCENFYPGTACSPISSTCAQACDAKTNCLGTSRQCYIPVKGNGPGTCETTCFRAGQPCFTSTVFSGSSENGTCSALNIAAQPPNNTQNICQLDCVNETSCPQGMSCSKTNSGTKFCEYKPCLSVLDCPNFSDYICLSSGGCVLKCVGKECPGSECTTSAGCKSGSSCIDGKCAPNNCGDGYVGNGELCDEGAILTSSCSGPKDCPNGWACNEGKCKPNIFGVGNGQNGHCSQDCKTICDSFQHLH